MRDLFLLLICVGFAGLGLVAPFAAGLGYIWVDFLAPQRIGYGLVAELLSSIADVTPKRGTVVLSRSPGEVVLRNNMVIGAKELGVPAPEDANVSFRTREAAGLPAYPEVARSLIEQARGQP